jgi:hypothetical protein
MFPRVAMSSSHRHRSGGPPPDITVPPLELSAPALARRRAQEEDAGGERLGRVRVFPPPIPLRPWTPCEWGELGYSLRELPAGLPPWSSGRAARSADRAEYPLDHWPLLGTGC